MEMPRNPHTQVIAPTPPHYVKAWRDFLELTQVELVEILPEGWTQEKLSKIEGQKQNLSVVELHELAGAMSRSTHELLHVDPNNQPEALSVADLAREATPGQQIALVKYYNFLKTEE